MITIVIFDTFLAIPLLKKLQEVLVHQQQQQQQHQLQQFLLRLLAMQQKNSVAQHSTVPPAKQSKLDTTMEEGRRLNLCRRLKISVEFEPCCNSVLLFSPHLSI